MPGTLGRGLSRIRNQKREERAIVRCNARLGGGRAGIPWVIIEEERAAPYFEGKKGLPHATDTYRFHRRGASVPSKPSGRFPHRCAAPRVPRPAEHIPGSSGVCVFETAFQEKMRALVPDMAAPLLVYGAGGSLDSAVAAEKLQREGYTDISLFAGGLEAWRKAGLPLEGAGVDFPVQDESPLPMFKEYTLIPRKALSSGRAITLSTAMTGRFPCVAGSSASHTARKGRGTGF